MLTFLARSNSKRICEMPGTDRDGKSHAVILSEITTAFYCNAAPIVARQKIIPRQLIPHPVSTTTRRRAPASDIRELSATHFH